MPLDDAGRDAEREASQETAPLQWTSTTPTEPGFYIVRTAIHGCPYTFVRLDEDGTVRWPTPERACVPDDVLLGADWMRILIDRAPGWEDRRAELEQRLGSIARLVWAADAVGAVGLLPDDGDREELRVAEMRRLGTAVDEVRPLIREWAEQSRRSRTDG